MEKGFNVAFVSQDQRQEKQFKYMYKMITCRHNEA